MKVSFLDEEVIFLEDTVINGIHYRTFFYKGIELVNYNREDVDNVNPYISLKELYAKFDPKQLPEMPKAGDVWMAWFPWDEDSTMAQRHPCIVVKTEDDKITFLAVKITSPSHSDYRDENGRRIPSTGKYPEKADVPITILDRCRELGLHDAEIDNMKIRIARIAELRRENLIEKKKPITSLKDVIAFSNLLKKVNSAINFEKEWKKDRKK